MLISPTFSELVSFSCEPLAQVKPSCSRFDTTQTREMKPLTLWMFYLDCRLRALIVSATNAMPCSGSGKQLRYNVSS